MALSLASATAIDFEITKVTKEGFVGANRESYKPAVGSSKYPIGHWLKTNEGATLLITFSSLNLFRLLPSTELQVNGEGDTNSKFRRVLQLKTGTVSLDLKALPKGTTIQVETPTAVCGAVGTAFSVNAVTGNFNITENGIYIRSNEDASFSAEGVHGDVTFQPGRENTYGDIRASGKFTVNGTAVNASQPIHLQIAKGKGGTGDAAVRVSRGTFASQGSGEYLMVGGKLQTVEPERASLFDQYVDASGKEGSLNLQRATAVASTGKASPALVAQLQAATEKATKLRNELFNRRVIREAGKAAAQSVINNVTRQSSTPRR